MAKEATKERIVINLPSKDCAWLADQTFQGCVRENEKFVKEVQEFAQQKLLEAEKAEISTDTFLSIICAADAAMKVVSKQKGRKKEFTVEFKFKE